MELKIFTFCQGAFNDDGKLTIVGTFDDYFVSQFPATISFGLAIKLGLNEREGGEKHISIKFLDPEGKEFLSAMTATVQVPENIASNIAFATNIQGVRFEMAGKYRCQLFIDDTLIREQSLEVKMK